MDKYIYTYKVSISPTLRERVFYSARDGMSLTLFALLYEKNDSEIDDLLNTDIDFNGVKCTPLIVAARNGREAAVRMILEKFKPPAALEIEGTVKFDEYVIEGATALWCAAGAGHLGIVKRLVRAGASVNHATRTQSTPLRAACFDGRLDIVKYLVRHGADIHKANKYNNTCLMISCYKGHLDVVQFLIEGGAKVNEKALCGATALHFAAECGHAAVVNTLIEHGAKIMENNNGLTPLQSAAERARAEVVEILINQPEVTRIQAIEGFELLGASFANDKEFYCAGKAYKYLLRAMEMRYDREKGILPKILTPPVPAYDNWMESSNLEELQRINGNSHALHMEGLTARERLLGRRCPDLPHPIVFRGAVFADEARFDRCLALWRHALVLRQENISLISPLQDCGISRKSILDIWPYTCHVGQMTPQVSLTKDLLRFAQVFSQMIHIGIDLPLEEVCFVLEACSEELKRGEQRMKSNEDVDKDFLLEEYESNVRTALYLVSVAARLLDTGHYNDKIKLNVGSAVLSLRDAKLKSGQTILHLAVDRHTPVDDFHTSDVCQFPCVQTTRLLIECGLDVDALDNKRRTALHTALISYQVSSIEDRESWSEALKSVVIELLAKGAHPDYMDENRVTPLVAAKGSPVEFLLKSTIVPRLSCVAARSMATSEYRYSAPHVPRVLHAFLIAHGVQEGVQDA